MKASGSLKRDRLNGEWKVYNVDGDIQEIRSFKYGEQVGQRKFYNYNDEGILHNISSHQNDKKDGPTIFLRKMGK